MHKPRAITQTPIKPQAEGKEKQMAVQEQAIEEEVIAENVEEEVVTTEGETETLDENGEPVVLEEWQKTEADELEGEKPVFEKSLKAKKKLKGLLSERETELTEQQKENEQLRLENERLKSGSLKTSEQGRLKRPAKSDFEDEYGDVDTDKYHNALDDYDDQRAELRRAGKKAQSNQEKYQATVNEGVESHYQRAEKLLEDSGINPDAYKSADAKFRKAVDEMLPGQGNMVTDHLIASLGEGSEKVAYFIGNNEAARLKLQSLLREDPNGLKAAMYLGSENQRLNTNKPMKRTSKAPSPATQIKGDAMPKGKEAAWKKKYDAASEGQAQYEIAKQARAEGYNTRKW